MRRAWGHTHHLTTRSRITTSTLWYPLTCPIRASLQPQNPCHFVLKVPTQTVAKPWNVPHRLSGTRSPHRPGSRGLSSQGANGFQAPPSQDSLGQSGRGGGGSRHLGQRGICQLSETPALVPLGPIPHDPQSSHRGESGIRMMPPPHSTNTAPERTHHSGEAHTGLRWSPPTREHSPPARTHRPQLLPQLEGSAWKSYPPRPAHPRRGHAPQAYWPGGPDPCPAPRAAARPPGRRHWRRRPPSSSHWPVCPPAVTAPRARGPAPAR